jgi:hypothetical protein
MIDAIVEVRIAIYAEFRNSYYPFSTIDEYAILYRILRLLIGRQCMERRDGGSITPEGCLPI